VLVDELVLEVTGGLAVVLDRFLRVTHSLTPSLSEKSVARLCCGGSVYGAAAPESPTARAPSLTSSSPGLSPAPQLGRDAISRAAPLHGSPSSCSDGAKRNVGRGTAPAATQLPESSKTGAATALRPASSSSTRTAKPPARTRSSSRSHSSASVIVCGVNRVSGLAYGAPKATSTFPTADTCRGVEPPLQPATLGSVPP